LNIASWRETEIELEHYLRAGEHQNGLVLLEPYSAQSWIWTCNTNYSYYAVALLSQLGEHELTMQKLKEAYLYGYNNFWKFNPTSHGWALELYFDKETLEWRNKDGTFVHQDPYYEKHKFLSSFYKMPEAMEFVSKCLNEKFVPAFSPSETPLCWLDKIKLSRKNAKSDLSNTKLAKDDDVYLVRYYNGSRYIPSDSFYIPVHEAEKHDGHKKNSLNFSEDSYSLKQFRFNVDYNHPLINFFWKDLENFEFKKTLMMIADPVHSPTPFVLTSPEGDEEIAQPWEALAGTGGESAQYDKELQYGL
jgi:hypothetical protein